MRFGSEMIIEGRFWTENSVTVSGRAGASEQRAKFALSSPTVYVVERGGGGKVGTAAKGGGRERG